MEAYRPDSEFFGENKIQEMAEMGTNAKRYYHGT
jgi:hypothetical protein